MNAEIPSSQPLLDIRNLSKSFPIQQGFLQRTRGSVAAVDGVSFYINERETLGMVGESGCGKTTVGRCIIKLYEPSAGEVLFRPTPDAVPVDLLKLSRAEWMPLRRQIAMVFQDPINSLNPRMTVGDIVAEPLVIHGLHKGRESDNYIASLLERVGLLAHHLKRYPHEFSGGQRQRIGIARALALQPKLIVCDEPVSALDVSIQAQTLNLLQDLQRDFGMAYLFIAHDLSVVQHISDRVAVMYVGRLVEMATSDALYARPRHPYSEALLSSAPEAQVGKRRERIHMQGDVADPANPPPGCHFHPRCRYAADICRTSTPALREIEPEHFAACHFANQLELAGV